MLPTRAAVPKQLVQKVGSVDKQVLQAVLHLTRLPVELKLYPSAGWQEESLLLEMVQVEQPGGQATN